MPSDTIWGQGGANCGGSPPVTGTALPADGSAWLNADASDVAADSLIGQGGAQCGGTADVM